MLLIKISKYKFRELYIMGNKVSRLDYVNINKIIDLPEFKNNNTSKYKHLIRYENGREVKVTFNKEEERKFQLKYKYAKMFKPIRKIKYSKITEVIKKDISPEKYIELNKNILEEDDKYIYNMNIVYDDNYGKDDGIYMMHMNKSQYDVFCQLKDEIQKSPSK